ncbi:MAG TPA: hypothetical protein VFX21_15585 [Acidimicrobiia bacterium]|nr:hypothetical protein [Acidimicrobiia bacterium]
MTALWGVGACDDGVTRVPWEISHDEIQREMGAAPAALAALGVGPGERVLFCSMLSEAGQFWPLIVGAMLAGAQLSCADANEGEAVRVAMFTRLMAYRAVLGVTPALLDGLDALDQSYADTFASVAVVGARPGAYERLERSGCTPHRFVLCGPAVAIGREPGGPAYVNDDEWELGLDGDHIVVTAKRPRATTFDRAPTAIRGALVDGGVVPSPVKEER